MRVVVVGCGFPQVGLVRRARALGLEVVGVDANARAVAVKDCDAFAEVSTRDLAAVAAVVKRFGAQAITTTGSELALTTTVAVAETLGLPFYADVATVRRAQEKDAMRAAYAQHDVSVPPFVSTSSFNVARQFADANGYPIVVKPTHGWGQRGVARVEDHGELETAFGEALALGIAAGGSEVVVEGFLRGSEYSVNGWIEGGALVSYCVTERITVPGNKPLGVMLAEVYGSGLSPEDEALVVEEARRGARAIGLTRGPCYSQVAFDPSTRTARLFETAARCGGGFDADVTRLASGVDLYTRVLGVATKNAEWERSGAEGTAHGGAIVQFLVGRPGTVRRVGGLDAARAIPGIHAAEVFAAEGDTVHPLTDGAKRAGYVLASGATRREAQTRADNALAQIELVTS